MSIAPQVLEKYGKAPHRPGVYLMKDARDKIIYVGKAANLKKRLASYFVSQRHDPKTAALLEMVRDFDTVITASGHEAFILESNLIKEYNPKYNVILKDGKNYPLLKIDTKETYPSIQKVRKIEDDHALYFGPYSSTRSMNQTLKQIQKIFRLRKCKNTQFQNRSRPCLNYQIKACLGLCCNEVDPEAYRQQVNDAILFLRGKSGQVVKKLKTRMVECSERLEFEKAAQLRDSIKAVENIMERQVVVSSQLEDRDAITVAADKGAAVITVMMIRAGFLIDTAHYPVDLGFKEADEVLPAFLKQYYRHAGFLPSTILLGQELEGSELLAEEFSRIKGKKVVILVPVRGEKKRVLEMALTNGKKELEKHLEDQEQRRSSLTLLKTLLKMDRLPERIECYDNSNLSGQDPVSAMVVFKNGQPDKKSYRKFIIRDIDFQDDYAYMYQALERRFRNPSEKMPLPDLLVVDGGKGQLNMAVAVIESLGFGGRFVVAGLAKKNEANQETEDKIFLPGRSNPLNADREKRALFLLQQVRDEAHRFAITFQRSRRGKRALHSVLDDIPGVGPSRRKMLLNHFKGISSLKNATMAQLCELPGINEKLAKSIRNHLSLKA